MAWNGLNATSILRVQQKLLLQVTPPATATHTPGPPTATASLTPVPLTATASRTPSPAATRAESLTPVVEGRASSDSSTLIWAVLIGLGVFGLALVVIFGRKRV